MGCQYFAPDDQSATSFTVAMPRLTFGRGTLQELGKRCAAQNFKRVAFFTDPHLLNNDIIATAQGSLTDAGVDFGVFSDIRIEPCDDTVARGVAFLNQGEFDAVVSVGGGSVIDTAKAALLVAANGGQFSQYVAAPIGESKAATKPLAHHIACPTTSGTGSECTSITVIRLNALNTKFVVANPALLPIEAIVDPQCCDSLSANTVASTGFDLCCHALECYTAKAYNQHYKVAEPSQRQYIQGGNPFSDIAAREALSIVGQFLVRGVNDKTDVEARDKLMWGATLAGIAFGNSGTHLPHAMSYGITHLMKDIKTDGYNVASPFVPHGISVVVNAPAIFRYTAEATPERHLQGASLLAADSKGATNADAGEVLSNRLVELMKNTHMPNGLNGVGFNESHIAALTDSSIRQARAIANAPRESNRVDIENMYTNALSYW